MKYNILIGERTFEVEIEDINKRPIVTHVNGQEILVSPETSIPEMSADSKPGSPKLAPIEEKLGLQNDPLVAPLPGTVIEVFVKAGDNVEAGQVILILEAMKMKNSIRSTKDGILAQVLVSAGQTVAHKQPLVEFQE